MSQYLHSLREPVATPHFSTMKLNVPAIAAALVSSVAVSKTEHGKGLGTEVVLGVERLARARDIGELFALSLSDGFFVSLDYEGTSVSRYPEKLARYEKLSSAGVEIVPKRCFKKVLGNTWEMPTLYEEPAKQLRAS